MRTVATGNREGDRDVAEVIRRVLVDDEVGVVDARLLDRAGVQSLV
jgi:hypothetical protein